jgi:hypothetical protein
MKRGIQIPPIDSEGNVQSELTLTEKIVALLKVDALLNSVVLMAIIIGFFHGWLKLKFRHPATTFLFDFFLFLALALVFLRLKQGEDFFPRGKVGGAIKAFFALCFIYILPSFALETMPPTLVALSALRSWCFSMLVFCLGYHMTRNIAQVKGYFYCLILCGVVTALYGLQQSPEEIERMAREDPYFAERYKFQRYISEEGKSHLRVFSTFISSGAFGSTMAYVLIFATVLLTEPRARKMERYLLIGAMIPIAYGMLLSGARTSLVSLAMGFLVIAWFRRNFQNYVIVPGLILLAFKLAGGATEGAVLQRFGTLADLESIFARSWIPTSGGLEFMAENWLGGGLGRTGYVPFFLLGRTGFNDYVSVDGDLGRLMIELGIPGLIFFGAVIWHASKLSYQSLVEVRESNAGSVALASAACFVMALGTFPSGSPFVGIPMGALTWFHFQRSDFCFVRHAAKSRSLRRHSPQWRPGPNAAADGYENRPCRPRFRSGDRSRAILL